MQLSYIYRATGENTKIDIDHNRNLIHAKKGVFNTEGDSPNEHLMDPDVSWWRIIGQMMFHPLKLELLYFCSVRHRLVISRGLKKRGSLKSRHCRRGVSSAAGLPAYIVSPWDGN